MTDRLGRPATVPRTAVVFGATGFIGKWLVKALLDEGAVTTAAVRNARSAGRLLDWLEKHGVKVNRLNFITVNLATDGIGIDARSFDTGDLADVREVFNVAGAYAFGMTPEEARAANVDTSRRVVEFAAKLPNLVRLVHLSGYRVGGQSSGSAPWSESTRRAEYARLGAYEASKKESDAVVQATARRLDVPLTVANPATVIGHSLTGESDQVLGLASSIRDLIAGRLRAIPGNATTFVPVVTIDYLTRFMMLLPELEQTRGKSYWVLDDDTPFFPELLQLIGDHHRVAIPRPRLPVPLIKRLPQSLTRAHPETLTFLSSDRYPTGPATELARSQGLRHPDVFASLKRWSDYLESNASGPSRESLPGPKCRAPWTKSAHGDAISSERTALRTETEESATVGEPPFSEGPSETKSPPVL